MGAALHKLDDKAAECKFLKRGLFASGCEMPGSAGELIIEVLKKQYCTRLTTTGIIRTLNTGGGDVKTTIAG